MSPEVSEFATLLQEAAANGQWWLLVGGILSVLALLARLVEAQITVPSWWQPWWRTGLNAATSVGAVLAVGQSWVLALLVALVTTVPPTLIYLIKRSGGEVKPTPTPNAESSGAARAPRRGAGPMLWMLALALLASGCTVSDAQTNIRSGLTAAGDSVLAADRILAPEMREARDQELAEIEAECVAIHGAGEPCPGAVAEYRRRMGYRDDGPDEGWAAVPPALRASLGALDGTDNGVEVWIDTGELPCCIDRLCTDAAESIRSYSRAVEAARGVPNPASVGAAVAAAEGVCRLIAPHVEGEAECDCDGEEAGDVE